jgi:hypothetical protein
MDSSHLMVQCLIDTVSRDLQKKLDATGVKLFLQPQKDTSGKLFTEHVSDLLVEYSSAVSLVISGLLTFMTSGDQIEVSVENDQEDILLRILSSCPLDALHAIPESDSGSMSACLRLAQETLAGHPPSTIFISLPINSAQAAAILVEKRMAHHV